jgi:hypothetical protein
MIKNHKLFLVLILLTGLSTPQAKSETVRSLKELQVKKISLRTDTTLKLPGTKHEVGLVVFTTDDRIHRTTGLTDGKLRWNNFAFEAEGATFSNGKVSISRVDSIFEKSGIPVKFYSVYEPEKVFFDTIKMDYIAGIELFPTKKFQKIPGETVDFGMVLLYQNGTTELFKSITKIDYFKDDFSVTPIGSGFRRSEFRINDNPLEIPEHSAGIRIQSKRNPEVYDKLIVTLDYKGKYLLNSNGSWGFNGTWGSSGSSGSTGEHGRNGQDGEPGHPGEHGHDLDVYVDAYFDTIINTTLIRVSAFDIPTQKNKYYLINPEGGSLHLLARGGDGGNGGDGGSGGAGGAGRNGETYTEEIKEIVITKDTAGREIKKEYTRIINRQRPGEEGGRGGDGGWGGPGAPGGNGGYVVVYHTPAAQPYLNLISIDVNGGSGGRGGTGAIGGSGGNGGSGNPSGRKGRNGRNGYNGPFGYEGNRGSIQYSLTDKILW